MFLSFRLRQGKLRRELLIRLPSSEKPKKRSPNFVELIQSGRVQYCIKRKSKR